jgi:tetratricopeptide (TPR) repeat protein
VKSAGSGGKSEFDPIGKSFPELTLEGERAFQAGDYDRAIQLMDYALTLQVNNQQAAAATIARGSAYALKGDLERALKDFETGLKLNPRATEGYRNRGILFAKKNDFDSAISDFTEAIDLKPDNWKPYLNRAEAFASKHEWEAEVGDLEKVLQLNPKCAPAYADRAAVTLRRKDYKRALEDSQKAIELDANYFGGYYARARAYIGLKKFPQAEQDLHTLPSLKAKNHSVHFNDVAWIRATSTEQAVRNGKEAISLARTACDLTDWKNSRCIDTLAAGYAEAGDFDAAIKFQQQAIDLAEDSAPPNISELRARLALYQKHQPYRDQMNP